MNKHKSILSTVLILVMILSFCVLTLGCSSSDRDYDTSDYSYPDTSDFDTSDNDKNGDGWNDNYDRQISDDELTQFVNDYQNNL